MEHELRRLRLARAALAANHDGLVSPRLLERREGVLGLLEAVGRQAAVGRVVVAADDVVAVDGEPPVWVTRDRRRRRQTPSSRRRLREGVIDAARSLERVHRDEDGPGIGINQIHAEAVLDVVEDRRLL